MLTFSLRYFNYLYRPTSDFIITVIDINSWRLESASPSPRTTHHPPTTVFAPTSSPLPACPGASSSLLSAAKKPKEARCADASLQTPHVPPCQSLEAWRSIRPIEDSGRLMTLHMLYPNRFSISSSKFVLNSMGPHLRMKRSG